MNYIIELKPEEIFEEQMTKWNTQGTFLTDQDKLTIQKCYAMQRIAFLIFSSKSNILTGLDVINKLMKNMIDTFKLKGKS